MWKPKQRQIDLNPGNGQEGGKYSNLQQYSVWEIFTTWMQVNTAAVPCFRNLNQEDWSSVGREQNNRITYGILWWSPHCIQLKASLLISAIRFDFLPYPLPIFCLFLFRFLEPYHLYCLFNALQHMFKDLWMYSAAQNCWAIVLAVPETLQILVMKVRAFLSTAMTPGGETQGSCSSRASMQIVFLVFCSSIVVAREQITLEISKSWLDKHVWADLPRGQQGEAENFPVCFPTVSLTSYS